jgi:hypothetical protein
MKTGKSFDCVEMKHRAAERVHKELKGKSVEQRVAYWQNEKRAMEKRLGRSKAA